MLYVFNKDTNVTPQADFSNIRKRTWKAKLVKLAAASALLPAHLRVARLMRRAGVPQTAQYSWKIGLRHLRNGYLRGCFPVRQSFAVAAEHYEMLLRHTRPGFLPKASSGGYPLWQYRAEDGRVFDIILRFPYFYNFDGDLVFTMACDGADICTVSVSIAPGMVVQRQEPHVMLVSGVQGIDGKIEEIRAATNACNNVSPANMLLAAIEAFALSIGVSHMVGTGSRIGLTSGAQFEFNYDAFWQPLAGVEESLPFYHFPLPFTDKPLEAIQAKHRSRAKKRRELRNIIRHDIMAHTHKVMLAEILGEANATAQDAPRFFPWQEAGLS